MQTPAIVQERTVPDVVVDRIGDRLSETAPATVERAYDQGGSFTFRVENIHFNAPVDRPIASAPPIGQDLTIEFYMRPQGSDPKGLDSAHLVASQKIGPSGKVEVDLPGGVPLFEVLRLPDGRIAQGRDGQVFHVGGMNFGRAAESGKCVGCHAGHTMMEMPDDPSWTNVAASAIVSANRTTEMPAIELLPFIGFEALEDERLMERSVFSPEKLVDRRTNRFSEWVGVASGRSASTIKLEWPVPIRGARARGSCADRWIRGLWVTPADDREDVRPRVDGRRRRPGGDDRRGARDGQQGQRPPRS